MKLILSYFLIECVCVLMGITKALADMVQSNLHSVFFPFDSVYLVFSSYNDH